MTGGPRAADRGPYGYDKYGNCHMVPNHALIIHSLLHGDDDFRNPYDRQHLRLGHRHNSGNVGCLLASSRTRRL